MSNTKIKPGDSFSSLAVYAQETGLLDLADLICPVYVSVVSEEELIHARSCKRLATQTWWLEDKPFAELLEAERQGSLCLECRASINMDERGEIPFKQYKKLIRALESASELDGDVDVRELVTLTDLFEQTGDVLARTRPIASLRPLWKLAKEAVESLNIKAKEAFNTDEGREVLHRFAADKMVAEQGMLSGTEGGAAHKALLVKFENLRRLMAEETVKADLWVLTKQDFKLAGTSETMFMLSAWPSVNGVWALPLAVYSHLNEWSIPEDEPSEVVHLEGKPENGAVEAAAVFVRKPGDKTGMTLAEAYQAGCNI